MQDVSSVYRWVVDDVISKVKPEFVHEGVDEAAIHELRELWEAKLFAGLQNEVQEGAVKAEDEEDTKLIIKSVKIKPEDSDEPRLPQLDGDEDSDDSDNNSQLGDSSDEEAFENDPQNLVLAQFEKVSRTKTRWKCQLKAGIMHVSGSDYIFNKALGEFQF